MVDTQAARTRRHATRTTFGTEPSAEPPALPREPTAAAPEPDPDPAPTEPDAPPARRSRHRAGAGANARWLGVGRPLVHRLLRGRRQVLLALGGGAAALAAVGSATAELSGAPAGGVGAGRRGRGSPRDAGAFADRDASYVSGLGDINNLGAAGLAATPGAAAAAALKATPKYPTPLSRDPVLHLLRRTTFGPTPQDVADVRQAGIDAWLDRQLDPKSIPDPAGDQVVAAFPTVTMSIAQLQGTKGGDYEAMRDLGRATVGRQICSSRQLFEVMVDFWANHLNVVNPLDGGGTSRGPYDRDVIRANALGRFSDMLQACARHPAMLHYLNNDESDKRSVNENYGRELLELHTVGIDGGYTETDVRQSAYIMTGRTVGRTGEFSYEPRRHWTGPVKVLGFANPNAKAADGLAVGDAYLTYLATHPTTANNVARKLVVRFVCDSPPAALVGRLAAAYLANGTAIVPVLRTLFRSQEFWIATGMKTRRPLENVVASTRLLGFAPGPDTPAALDDLYNLAGRLGQAPLAWGPPNGYPDVAGAWSSAHAMLGMWNSHRALMRGGYKGMASFKPEQLVANRPATTAGYVDALASRLVFQPLSANERAALLKFLGAGDGSKPADATLGGRLGQLAPLLLDSVYHALR